MAIRKQTPKVIFSTTMAILAMPLAYVNPIFSAICLLALSGAWLVPDKNIERAINELEK